MTTTAARRASFHNFEAHRLRIDAFTSRKSGPIWSCDEHAAVLASGRHCPGPALDQLLERAVSVRAAYAFGDWPPAVRS